MNIISLLKILFSLSSFFVFLYFFGLPSWRKYQAKEVYINKHKISIHDIPPPAITFCALNHKSSWKPDNSSTEANMDEVNYADIEYTPKSFILRKCENSNTVEEIFDCVDDKTFSFAETIPAASSEVSFLDFSDISSPAFWISEITIPYMGKCHTLNNSIPLGGAKWIFYLDPSLTYTTYIHDPHYFLMTANPATIPMINLVDMDLTQGLLFMYVEVVNHVNMDRPNQPCEAAKDYSFTACTRNSVTSKVGCRYAALARLGVEMLLIATLDAATLTLAKFSKVKYM